MNINLFNFKDQLKTLSIKELRKLKNDYVIKRCKGDRSFKTLYKIQAIATLLLKGV